MKTDHDWIVVGSGFGGSVAALRLAEKGYDVTVLEQGRRFADEDFAESAWQARRVTWLPRLGLRGIMAVTPFRHITVLSGVGVGGGSLVYGNTLYEPTADAFYRHPNWADLADWRAVLAPHFATARRMLGVTRFEGDGPSERLMAGIAADLGVADSLHPTEVGVFFGRPGERVPDPYFDGAGPDRSGCVRCGQCMLGCRHNAKNTLVKNYLHLAERLGARIEASRQVVDVRPLDGAEGATGYAVTSERPGWWLRRRRRTETAHGVVLAAGTLGTNRLLRHCRDRGSLPRLSARVGEEVRTNSEAITAVTAPRGTDLRADIAITASVHPDADTHFTNNTYGDGGDALALSFGPPAPARGRLPRLALGLLRHPLRWLSPLRPRGWSRRSVVFTVMQSLDSSLRLVPRGPGGRLDTEVGEDGAPSRPAEIANRIAELAARRTGGYAQSAVPESVRGAPMTAHILGGAIIGRDAERGVVDRFRRAFGYRDLLVLDGSTLPANVGVNPSLTITAMAEEAIEHVEPKSSGAVRGRSGVGVTAKASLRDLRRAFGEAPVPTLDDLVGLREAEYAGPLWLRSSGAPTMALTGMPRWYGKRFAPPAAGASGLDGVNVLRRGARLVDSIPMRAEIAPSRHDGKPAIVVSYPGGARWPWRRVNDELRPIGDGSLLGLTFGLPLAPPRGVPFLLHRRD